MKNRSHVILVDQDGTVSRSSRLHRGALLWGFGFLLVANLVAVGALLWSNASSRAAATLQQSIEEQKMRLMNLSDQAEGHRLAVGRHLATMQARLLRMEALGQRLTEQENLTEGEFRFGEPVPVGGSGQYPADHSAGEGGADYFDVLHQLSEDLRRTETEFNVLDSVLTNRRLEEERSPITRPIKRGWISSLFGNRVDPITGRPAWHAGVDFAGALNSDVIAVAGGVVVFVGERHGYGNMVEIDHGNGYRTRYAHQNELIARAGDLVRKGQVIGKMGNTGRSTGPHVHFEVLKDGRHINPMRYLSKR